MISSSQIVLLSVVLGCVWGQNACPPNFTPFGFNPFDASTTSCMTTIQGAPYENYANANKRCKGMGGILVKITSAAENDAVWKAMMAYGWRSGMRIGIEKKADGSFLYSDGTPMIYSKWAPNYYPSTNPSALCAQIDPSSGMWLPSSCLDNAAFMCSVDLLVKKKQ